MWHIVSVAATDANDAMMMIGSDDDGTIFWNANTPISFDVWLGVVVVSIEMTFNSMYFVFIILCIDRYWVPLPLSLSVSFFNLLGLFLSIYLLIYLSSSLSSSSSLANTWCFIFILFYLMVSPLSPLLLFVLLLLLVVVIDVMMLMVPLLQFYFVW